MKTGDGNNLSLRRDATSGPTPTFLVTPQGGQVKTGRNAYCILKQRLYF